MKKKEFEKLMMMLLYRCTNVRGRQNRENIGLERRYQQFNQANESRKNGHRKTHNDTFKDENHAQKTKQNDVTRRNVGKQTNHQREWLHK